MKVVVAGDTSGVMGRAAAWAANAQTAQNCIVTGEPPSSWLEGPAGLPMQMRTRSAEAAGSAIVVATIPVSTICKARTCAAANASAVRHQDRCFNDLTSPPNGSDYISRRMSAKREMAEEDRKRRKIGMTGASQGAMCRGWGVGVRLSVAGRRPATRSAGAAAAGFCPCGRRSALRAMNPPARRRRGRSGFLRSQAAATGRVRRQ